MVFKTEQAQVTELEELFGEFNELLRTTGRADFGVLERCPEVYRKELRSLMNVAALAYRALEPQRERLAEESSTKLAS